MPKIYAEEAVNISDVEDIEGREIRNAFSGKNITYIGLNGEEAAACINYRDYRFLVAANLLAKAVSEHSGRNVSVPEVISDVVDSNSDLKINTSDLRKFPDQVAQYDAFMISGDVYEINAYYTKKVRDRKEVIPLNTYKALSTKDKALMREYLTPQEFEQLNAPRVDKRGNIASAALVNYEDAKFVETLTGEFLKSASLDSREFETKQIAYDAILLENMVAYYNQLTGAAMPSEIVSYYTRFDGVKEAANINEGPDGYRYDPDAA